MGEGFPELIIDKDVNPEKRKEIVSLDELQLLVDKLRAGEITSKKMVLIDGNRGVMDANGEYSLRFSDYGLRRLVGYLEKFGVDVNLIKLQDKDNEANKKLLEEAEIIGLGALATGIEEASDFLREVKEGRPDTQTILGGEEALNYEQILRDENSGIDLCCIGQGELPLLALALGVPEERIGSIVYGEKDGEKIKLNKNLRENGRNFPVLSESADKELLRPAQAIYGENEAPFVELDGHFVKTGRVCYGVGCPQKCDFCANEAFYGGKTNSPEIFKKELAELDEDGINFVFLADALMNENKIQLDGILRSFEEINEVRHEQGKAIMNWAGFMNADKQENCKQFERMAKAGCIEIAVGVEDIVGDRTDVNKSAGIEIATKFINEAREHLMVRTLLILGLPGHYELKREDIKAKMLAFMKTNPQALYRTNVFTPIAGSRLNKNFEKFILPDTKRGEFDTMHNVMDIDRLYAEYRFPDGRAIDPENKWIKDKNDWSRLGDEIAEEYLNSREHNEYLESLKIKNELYYSIASNFKRITLAAIESAK